MSGPPVVAIINTSDDLVELLKMKIEAAGFVVTTVHVSDIRAAQFDAESFLRLHDPKVIVYDVVAPYDRSWRFLDHLRTSPGFEHRRFVLTSMNPARVHDLVKTDETVYEVVGQDEDIAMVVQAVKEAARARPTR